MMRRSMNDPTLVVEQVEDTTGFEKLTPEWGELLSASASNHLFLTWEWLFTWWKYLSEDRQLRILTVRRDRQLCAIAPLALRPWRPRRLLPFSALEFLGTGSVGSDYLDIVVRHGEAQSVLPALAKFLNRHPFMLELSQVNYTAPDAVNLALELRQHGWGLSRVTTDICPYINLSGHSWESYLGSLSSAHRHNFRRRFKTLGAKFDVRFEQAVTEEQRRQALRWLVTLHRERWREHGGTTAFHTPALMAFHDELSRLVLQRGWLRLYTLQLDGTPVAAVYGFLYNGVFYFYQTGFNLDYRNYSVGLVATGLAIQRAITEGARDYDFLHGDETYKFLWARQERDLVRLEIYPPRVHGAICRRTLDLRSGIKKLVCRYSPSTQSA